MGDTVVDEAKPLLPPSETKAATTCARAGLAGVVVILVCAFFVMRAIQHPVSIMTPWKAPESRMVPAPPMKPPVELTVTKPKPVVAPVAPVAPAAKPEKPAEQAYEKVTFTPPPKNGVRDEDTRERLELFVDHGLAVSGITAPKIDAKAWNAELDKVLAAGPSRYIFSPSIPQVKAALLKDLTEETKGTGKEESFSVGGPQKMGYNLVSQIPGSDPKSFFVVGAHYDTVPRSGAAPGAEDNGSGVATLLAIAKALANMDAKPKHTIEFVLFSGEEEGLLGSSAYVQKELVEKGRQADFQGAIIMDEVSFTRAHGDYHVIFETSGSTDKTNRIVDTLGHATKQAAPDVQAQVNYHGFGSDHMSFLNHNLPAVLVIERDNMWYADKYGHSHEDTKDKVDPELGARVASLVAQATVDLAVEEKPAAGPDAPGAKAATAA